MRFLVAGLFVIGFLISITGCRGKVEEKLVPASGIVTINGKPAADIMVQFVPMVKDESVRASSSQALTDENGSFDLVAMDGRPGAALGPHRVSLYDTKESRLPQGQRGGTTSRLDSKFSSGAINVTIAEDTPIKIEATGRKK